MPERKSKYILAIDLGTSGVKSGIVSTRGEVADCEIEKIHTEFLPAGGAEQDPDEWWNVIMDSSRKMLGRRPVPVDDIAAVCCTTQWSGTVAVDRGDSGPFRQRSCCTYSVHKKRIS